MQQAAFAFCNLAVHEQREGTHSGGQAIFILLSDEHCVVTSSISKCMFLIYTSIYTCARIYNLNQ